MILLSWSASPVESYSQHKLIDDSLFTDTSSLSVTEIQTFLNSRGGFLKSWRDEVNIPFPGKYQNGDGNGVAEQCYAHKKTNKTAAQIIHEAANNWQARYVVWRDVNNNIIPSSQWANTTSANIKSCRTETANWPAYGLSTVSPKVILTTLQKEQSIITAGGSYSLTESQYNDPCNGGTSYPCYAEDNEYKLVWAMGYGFPDSGKLNYRFTGFYNQVNWGAWQLRYNFERSAASPNNSCAAINLSPTQSGLCWDDVEYLSYGGPMTSGTYVRSSSSSPVSYTKYWSTNNYGQWVQASISNYDFRVDNRATASLYYYTPHACSSGCGNYRFVQIYEGWFGAVDQVAYSVESIEPPPSQMVIGEKYTTTIRLKNESDVVWYSDGNTPSGMKPFRLMTKHYANHPFADTSDSSWLGTKNQVRMTEASVSPGQVATFTFKLVAPDDSRNSYTSTFNLVQDGVKAFTNPRVQFTSGVIWDYSFTVKSVEAPPVLYSGDMREITIKMVNTGARHWYSESEAQLRGKRPIRVSTVHYMNSPFALPSVDDRWLGTKNQIRMLEDEVPPGGEATFKALISGPYREMLFNHRWRIVLDGVKVASGIPASRNTYTPVPDLSYSFVSAQNPPENMYAGTTALVNIKIRNDGNTIWVNNQRRILDESNKVIRGDLRMVTARPTYHDSVLASNTAEWLETSNQVKLKESVVVPGQVATFEFTITSPTDLGTYLEFFKPVLDGVTSLRDKGFVFRINSY